MFGFGSMVGPLLASWCLTLLGAYGYFLVFIFTLIAIVLLTFVAIFNKLPVEDDSKGTFTGIAPEVTSGVGESPQAIEENLNSWFFFIAENGAIAMTPPITIKRLAT